MGECRQERMMYSSRLLSPVYGSLFLVASTKIGSKEVLSRRIELEAVFGFCESVSFIGEKHVFVSDAFTLHRFDNLLGFGLLDPWIVVSLSVKHGDLDLVDFVVWRA